MSGGRARNRGVLRGSPTLAAVLLIGVLVGVPVAVLEGSAGTSRAAAGAGGEPTPQTDAGVPAPKVTMIGASPGEAPGETWGLGEVSEGLAAFPTRLVRYTTDSGWGTGPALQDADGSPLQGFRLDHPEGIDAASPLAGQITFNGAGAMIGTVPAAGGEGSRQIVLVRHPGGAFQATPPVVSEGEGELLKPGERLFGDRRAPLLAALDEGGGRAGALVVPIIEAGSVEDGVLHWDGNKWTREPISVPENSGERFRVLALAASSPDDAWLLARLSDAYPSGAVALFRRVPGEGGEAGGFVWKPVAVGSGGGAEEAHPLTADGQPFTVRGSDPPTVESQVLSVTGEGVWIDGERADAGASTTLYFKPSPGSHALDGHVQAAWCLLPAGAPAGSPECDHALPAAVPSGPSRSIAWPNPSLAFGERVITGLSDGVSMRLDGESFTRVLALGGSARDPGGSYGAAFSNPREGWLGAPSLPVHLTESPVASRLAPWPVPFRHSLDAVVPRPGVAAGAISSEALAVGERGQVARYTPGKGWLPESLFGAGHRQTPHLRAVAWPTPGRAFAVGDLGQMWRWRGETGLWEPDPAAPRNFRGNLLGVAFDPSNPARGYVVGSGGVLLRYGKSWSQEALPAQVQGASFTSIAFAGSQAIVAYRILPNRQVNHFVGGVLLNDGTGWRVDEDLAAKLGENAPDTVAGLADGGAAVSASGSREGPAVYERQAQASPWQPTASPLPPASQPGSLALFREGGALRVIAAGGPANGFGAESVTPAPPGFPPNLIAPYGPVGGGVLRQTASGWSDEQHELDFEGKELPGGYAGEDKVYEPDPVFAVMIAPDGSQGWAVGGFAGSADGGLSTGDVARYPADGTPPSGIGASVVPTNSESAAFAIGGGAQCLAPCADRANARLGPDVWLTSALARAGQVAGVRSFLYTGPHVTTGQTNGPETVPVPFARELPRYAELLASSPVPAFAAITPDELDARPFANGTERTFEQSFSRFPRPFGTEPEAAAAGLTDAGRSEECADAVGCEAAYYALDSAGAGGTVRVVMLDNSHDVGPTQRAWLAGQLTQAGERSEPAIVLGASDLAAEVSAGDGEALATAQVLVQDHASAYFYDSPEENVSKVLRFGSGAIPSYGSGTLGYVSLVNERSSEFHGASGFLLAQVKAAPAARNPVTKLFPVTARLIPSIGELAMEGKDGTLLRRSQAALFSALARRPRAGGDSHGNNGASETDPYIPIPSNCVGAGCAGAILPEYTFSSSRPDIGDFVRPNLASPDPHAVLLGPNDKPISSAQSGLFCAYNAGTTVVTISAGGLSASVPVTVQAGSVRRPCGTQPSQEAEASQAQRAPLPPPSPTPSPAPTETPPGTAPTPLPVPALPAPAAQPSPTHPPAPAPHFLTLAPPIAPLLPFVPPPLPTPARPSPPTGTSAVTSPIEVAEKEEEEEEATESVSNQAVAYRPSDGTPSPAYLIGLVTLAAFAGATVRRRPRRGLRRPRVAPALLIDGRTRPPHRGRRRL